MAGINAPEYLVTIEFFVYADNDDDALHKVTRDLEYGREDIAWAWKKTQLINKGETNDTND
jgi:hypothetical protein